jgi:hypothetical protein
MIQPVRLSGRATRMRQVRVSRIMGMLRIYGPKVT